VFYYFIQSTLFYFILQNWWKVTKPEKAPQIIVT